MLLLDTCVFLWLRQDSNRLSPAARQGLMQPDAEAFLSAISVWEIMVKHAAGKLPLPREPEAFIATGRQVHALQPLPFSEACALHLSKLPPLHRDPFDWMLICQAIEHGLTLVTPDPHIRQYPIKTLW